MLIKKELPGDRDSKGVVPRAQEIRAAIDGTSYLSRAECVDWLLDLLNSADRSSVQRVIRHYLVIFSHGNLTPSSTFIAALEEIELAFEVDAVFDHFEFEDRS